MSWQGLIQIKRDMRQILEEDRAKKLVACPMCGQPLVEARNVLHCPFDGSTYAV